MFDSCSAYQNGETGAVATFAAAPRSRPEILYLSHCVPDPPDKGERIRASHELRRLARSYRVHLVCFARTPAEVEAAGRLRSICTSVYAERFDERAALFRAGLRFLTGASLSAAFYSSAGMRRHIARLSGRVAATVAFSSAMAPAAPAHLPLLLDMVDVDSEKWFEYARLRFPSLPYRVEGERLQRLEAAVTRRAAATIVTTNRERSLLQQAIPRARIEAIANGVDSAHFHPGVADPVRGGRLVAFVGAMGYYPNADAVEWYAREVHPQARRSDPELRFAIVGRDPGRAVRRLAGLAGVEVTGTVPDVRPYLAGACAVVAPLRVARGIQNKVLEALAMGKPVLASPAVCATFDGEVPEGVIRCDSREEYLAALDRCRSAAHDPLIRAAAVRRFSWERAMNRVHDQLAGILAGRDGGAQ